MVGITTPNWVLNERLIKFMFGLGYLEIALIVLLLIVFFGGYRTGRGLGKTYGAYQKVNGFRQILKNPLSFFSKDK